MTRIKTVVTKTSKQLADALGLDPVDALAWEVRYGLVKKIIEIASKKKLSVTEIAERAKTSRARITSILKGNSDGISLDILLKVLCAVGQEIKISFKKIA